MDVDLKTTLHTTIFVLIINDDWILLEGGFETFNI